MRKEIFQIQRILSLRVSLAEPATKPGSDFLCDSFLWCVRRTLEESFHFKASSLRELREATIECCNLHDEGSQLFFAVSSMLAAGVPGEHVQGRHLVGKDALLASTRCNLEQGALGFIVAWNASKKFSDRAGTF